jgi:hypothetical protein
MLRQQLVDDNAGIAEIALHGGHHRFDLRRIRHIALAQVRETLWKAIGSFAPSGGSCSTRTVSVPISRI